MHIHAIAVTAGVCMLPGCTCHELLLVTVSHHLTSYGCTYTIEVLHSSQETNHHTAFADGYATVDVQEKHGAVFESDTDTEVFPKLLKYVFSKIDKLSHHQPTLPELVMEVMSQLEGAFALLIKSSHYPGELVAAKRG